LHAGIPIKDALTIQRYAFSERMPCASVRRCASGEVVMKFDRLLNTLARAGTVTQFRPDRTRDCFLASYPRSGNTWLRAILFHARIGRAPADLAEIDLGIPDEHYPVAARSVLAPVPGSDAGQIVKTHTIYRIGTSYRSVAYILRDPRDAIPSYYRYLSRNGSHRGLSFWDFAQACISGSVWPGSWYEHVQSFRFYRSLHPDRIEIFRYEDLVAQPPAEIARLGYALNLPADANLSDLFRHYDLARMRGLEETGNRPSEKPAGFIGNGRADEGPRAFVDAAIRRDAPHWRDLMAELGYRV
jgi:hypothetical protein